MLRVLYLCLSWALLLLFPTMVSANTHSKCYCILNNASSKCLTTKACDIYQTSKQKFNGDPSKATITMFWHICAATEPEESGRVWYTRALGGNEFKQSCLEAQSSGACPESAGGQVESNCFK
ncbi:hypothetical protein LY76DRAFT_588551 [Colletotrichum caudatum]|nr:hypothetical protein LY76DRAFT_588551 [Colletotrichum caudatum]